MQSQKGGAKKEGIDEALAATRSMDQKGRKKGKCHNCGKPGHWAKECCSPKKETSTTETLAQSSTTTPETENKPVGSVNAVIGYDSEGDGFWMAMESEDQVHFLTTDPDPLLPEGEEIAMPNVGTATAFVWGDPFDWDSEGDLGDWPSNEGDMAMATITTTDANWGTRIKLYDTGATCHLSPFKNDFKTYRPLTPPILRLLNTANQQHFQVIGSRSMAIQVHNGDAESEVLLQGVLYVPSTAYTLVSLGTLDEEGYCMSVGGGYLEITEPYGQRVGQIVRTLHGLYHVAHEEEANTIELLSVMELHQWMRHIAPSTVQKLVNSRAITGVKIDHELKESHCNVCLYAHMTCKPIPSVWIKPPLRTWG